MGINEEWVLQESELDYFGHDILCGDKIVAQTCTEEVTAVSEQEFKRAHLIVAAPDLLEALEGIFEHCALVHKYWGDADNTKQADDAQRAALAALAKARGETR